LLYNPLGLNSLEAEGDRSGLQVDAGQKDSSDEGQEETYD